jgi:hypothetical protein
MDGFESSDDNQANIMDIVTTANPIINQNSAAKKRPGMMFHGDQNPMNRM